MPWAKPPVRAALEITCPPPCRLPLRPGQAPCAHQQGEGLRSLLQLTGEMSTQLRNGLNSAALRLQTVLSSPILLQGGRRCSEEPGRTKHACAVGAAAWCVLRDSIDQGLLSLLLPEGCPKPQPLCGFVSTPCVLKESEDCRASEAPCPKYSTHEVTGHKGTDIVVPLQGLALQL